MWGKLKLFPINRLSNLNGVFCIFSSLTLDKTRNLSLLSNNYLLVLHTYLILQNPTIVWFWIKTSIIKILGCLWVIWINKWVIEVLHPFTDLEINGGFSSSHLYCYMPYVSFKPVVAYMKCKHFQIQRRLFLLQTSELSDWYFCVLGIVCWNRWKWQRRISWCPCTPKNQFRHGTNNFKKMFSDSFYIKKN